MKKDLHKFLKCYFKIRNPKYMPLNLIHAHNGSVDIFNASGKCNSEELMLWFTFLAKYYYGIPRF